MLHESIRIFCFGYLCSNRLFENKLQISKYVKYNVQAQAHCRDYSQPNYPSWPHLRCDVGLEEGEYK